MNAETRNNGAAHDVKVTARDVNVYYGAKHALKGVSLDMLDRQVTALIGPSGCGKSTFLRCLNRMNDTIDGCRVEGKIDLDGADIYDKSLDVVQLRARVGMVFQKPNPFPKSIYDNVAYGPRIHGLVSNRAGDRRDRRAEPAQCRPLGGGQGSSRRNPARPCRAASSSGSASRAPSRSAPR